MPALCQSFYVKFVAFVLSASLTQSSFCSATNGSIVYITNEAGLNNTSTREAEQDFTDWDCEETMATGRKIMTAVYIGAAILTFEVLVTLGFGVRKIIYDRERILESLGRTCEKLRCAGAAEDGGDAGSDQGDSTVHEIQI